MSKIESAVIYCTTSNSIKEAYFEAAKELGKKLAENNIRVENGFGADPIKYASERCISASGNVTGVIPRFMIE
jgi:predicted Rossmann-fold nucleotide-binding protein